MLALRFPKLWLGLGWVLLALVCLGSLLPASAVSTLENDKLAHFGSYLILSLWFGGLYGKPRHYIAIAAILIAFGAVLDLLQGLTATRHFDAADILANSAGVLLGFLVSVAALGGWCRVVERWIAR